MFQFTVSALIMSDEKIRSTTSEPTTEETPISQELESNMDSESAPQQPAQHKQDPL